MLFILLWEMQELAFYSLDLQYFRIQIEDINLLWFSQVKCRDSLSFSLETSEPH